MSTSMTGQSAAPRDPVYSCPILYRLGTASATNPAAARPRTTVVLLLLLLLL